MRDFAIELSDQAGELARVTNALSLAGVNLKSLAALTVGNRALVRLLPDDPEAARNTLREKNIRFEETEVVVVLLENRPGELTDLAMKLADAGVNLKAVYVLGVADDLIELAVCTDDVKKARRLLA